MQCYLQLGQWLLKLTVLHLRHHWHLPHLQLHDLKRPVLVLVLVLGLLAHFLVPAWTEEAHSMDLHLLHELRHPQDLPCWHLSR